MTPELRERLADALYNAYAFGTRHPEPGAELAPSVSWRKLIDELLAEIAAAGYHVTRRTWSDDPDLLRRWRTMLQGHDEAQEEAP